MDRWLRQLELRASVGDQRQENVKEPVHIS